MDLATWLMGDPKPVAVTGCTYRKFAESSASDSVHSQFGEAKEDGVFDVEDLAIGFIRFDNGASLQIEFSWASNVAEENVFIELRGSKAGCYWNNQKPLRVFAEDSGALLDVSPKISPLPREGHDAVAAPYARRVACVARTERSVPIW